MLSPGAARIISTIIFHRPGSTGLSEGLCGKQHLVFGVGRFLHHTWKSFGESM